MQRRTFLKTASWAALAQLSGVSPLRSMAALAQSAGTSDYKAVVCLFLRGGNDSNNMIVPLGGLQYLPYAAARGAGAVQPSQLLQLPGIGYGLHPAFPNLQKLYASGHAALIANVGPLVQPTTAAQVRAGTSQLPEQLYDHGRQQQIWEAGDSTPGIVPSWSGLTADLLGPSYNSPNLPMVSLLGTASNFGRGRAAVPFQVSGGAQGVGFWCSEGLSCYPRASAAQQLLALPTDVKLLQADEQIYQSAYKYNDFYNGVLSAATGFKTPFPSNNPLSASLYTVATMIQLRARIGARRQIFMVDAGGFDTHANQGAAQPGLFGMIDQATAVFAQVMQEMGVYNQVTLFTASDFNRTLSMNTVGGSDHAWGGHHFVLGGAVKGGSMYGAFPNLDPHGPDDVNGTGRFVPQTALSQYMATIASWFGVPQNALGGMFPGLANFGSPNLGFV